MWRVEPMIINPGILSGSWTVSLCRPQFSPGNRELLVKHDVPVGKITAAAVAWECALGLYTKNAVTLHQSCMMDKLDLYVYVRVTAHWQNTPMSNTPPQMYVHTQCSGVETPVSLGCIQESDCS